MDDSPAFSREALASLGSVLDGLLNQRVQSLMVRQIQYPSDAWKKPIYENTIVVTEREHTRALELKAPSEANA